ncbi:hypothetical protein [Caulobacter sp. S45]|jgi:hypothetical protein|uniref:hypothetical protein n=1 Tax=Caulobacter sp. S45 TaxID=1641861 RepID=UPI00131A825F|nr:hypothetical protein [Caulobacter sp. S45]
MILVTAIGLAVLSLHSTPPLHSLKVEQWIVQTRIDGFNGKLTCRLGAPGMAYRPGVIVFRLGRFGDTAAAEFRLDSGSAMSVRTVDDEAASARFHASLGEIDFRSWNVVALPLESLVKAERIDIRPSPTRSARSFKLSGLSRAMDAAHNLGCKDENF